MKLGAYSYSYSHSFAVLSAFLVMWLDALAATTSEVLNCEDVSCVGTSMADAEYLNVTDLMNDFGFVGLDTSKITDFLNSTESPLFQFYECSFCQDDTLKMFGVCSVNATDPAADCVAVGFYGSEECSSTQVCSLGEWDVFSFSIDCSGVKDTLYPDCKLTCAHPSEPNGLETCGVVPTPAPSASSSSPQTSTTLNTASSSSLFLKNGDLICYGSLILSLLFFVSF